MRILVPVTEVAVPASEFDIDGVAIDDRYLTYDMNEWDEYAVEAAVQLSETHGDVEVVAVTVGPERAEETIRQALATGVDRAVRVWDEGLAGETLLDPATKAELLAGVAREEDPDLILSGVQSGDAAFGATGVMLAAELGLGWAAVVNHLELDREGGVAAVHRELEGGVAELSEVDLPAVLTVQTGLNEPRYASLRGIREAQNKPLETKTPAAVGVADVDPSLRLTSLTVPETERDVALFEGDPDEAAAGLAELLRERGVGA